MPLLFEELDSMQANIEAIIIGIIIVVIGFIAFDVIRRNTFKDENNN